MRESRSISVALLALAFALFALHSPAQAREEALDDTVKCIAAIKCNCGIKIDGIIDESIWDSAPLKSHLDTANHPVYNNG